MYKKSRIAVVGADGFVGGFLAKVLQTEKIVYRSPNNGEVHISQAENALRKSDVIINAAGFRVRPGLTYADYQRTHAGATSALIPFIRKNALLIHISSASVLGKSKNQALGNDTTPQPQLFPSPAYGLAKIEADQLVQKAAAENGFRLILMRPSVLYAPNGEGMIDSLLKVAKRGIILRLYPRRARHHLCDMNLFTETVQKAIQKEELPNSITLVVADPFTITNRELEEQIRNSSRRKCITLPFFLGLTSFLMRHSFHSKNPKIDLVTWGEILGVMNLDTVYDPTKTFELLGIDPSLYSRDNTLDRLIKEAFQS